MSSPSELPLHYLRLTQKPEDHQLCELAEGFHLAQLCLWLLSQEPPRLVTGNTLRQEHIALIPKGTLHPVLISKKLAQRLGISGREVNGKYFISLGASNFLGTEPDQTNGFLRLYRRENHPGYWYFRPAGGPDQIRLSVEKHRQKWLTVKNITDAAMAETKIKDPVELFYTLLDRVKKQRQVKVEDIVTAS